MLKCTLHASWGMNSTDVTFHREMGTEHRGGITGYVTVTKCGHKSVRRGLIQEHSAVGPFGKHLGADESAEAYKGGC